MNLYIIGNGFDLAHGLKTSYWDFRCYLQKYAEDFLVEFEKLYGIFPLPLDDYYIPFDKQKDAIKRWNDSVYNELWRCFEESLGHADEESMLSFSDSIVKGFDDLDGGPVNIEDTLNAYWKDEYSFVSRLQEYLLKWARQIRMNKAVIKKKELDSSHLYLTFNYTPLLERVYKINCDRICHIHGGIPPYCLQTPIIGHGNSKVIENYRNKAHEAKEVYDEGTTSISNAIADFYKRTFKDTDRALFVNNSFFAAAGMVEEVHVIGHSLGEVDMPYFTCILVHVGDKVPWRIYCYTNKEEPKLENRAKGFGITNIRMHSASEFWD